MTRYWQISGGITAREEVEKCVYNLFWYCCRCGEIYGRAWVVEPNAVWRALGGTCLTCRGDKWNVPGSLENVAVFDWNVPVEIARYQLDREIAFTRHPDHPWNKEHSSET